MTYEMRKKAWEEMPQAGSVIQKFRTPLPGDDVDEFMQLVDKDAVWTFMATGEKFRGPDQIRMCAERAIAGRLHTKDKHVEVTNLFSTEDQLCIEYLYRPVVPEHGTASAGTEIGVPTCITMHVKNGKFDRFNEYVDMATFSAATEHLSVQNGGGAPRQADPSPPRA
jgi:ketosteroid isomerase-like protein